MLCLLSSRVLRFPIAFSGLLPNWMDSPCSLLLLSSSVPCSDVQFGRNQKTPMKAVWELLRGSRHPCAVVYRFVRDTSLLFFCLCLLCADAVWCWGLWRSRLLFRNGTFATSSVFFVVGGNRSVQGSSRCNLRGAPHIHCAFASPHCSGLSLGCSLLLL
jgi:hypothetical protein